MKILHVITGLAKVSGVSTFVGGVGESLCDLGHDVFVATVKGSVDEKDYCLDARIKVVAVAELLSSSIRFDVIHIHGIWNWWLHRVSRWAHRKGMPVAWSLHGMVAPWSLRHKWWKKVLPWLFYQKPDLKSAQLLHVTVPQEELWVRDLGFKQTVAVVPLGTALPNEVPPRTRPVKTLLFVGRIYPVKGLDRLVEAWSLIPKASRQSWQLRLVGPDQAGFMGILKRRISELGLLWADEPDDAEVVFVGPRFGIEMDQEYANCDCLVLPSYTENFGATVIDALARKVPCIASKNTPWKELDERGCGWWVENDPKQLAETILRMMSLGDLERAEMGGRGYALVVAKYTWIAVGAMLEQEYGKILAGKKNSLKV